jgi:phosphoglycerate dehydrogenase-like enzyme
MPTYPTLFITERGLRHQQDALNAAPAELAVTMLRRPTREELWPHLAATVFWISERTGTIDAEMIQAASQLKMILRLGSLTYDIDLDAARAAGVVIAAWPQRGVIMVAEHLVMQMLALRKQLRQVEAITLAAGDWGLSRRTDEDTFAYNWSGRQDIGGLWRSTIGILGFGEIGAELARRLAGWDCRVLYHRRRRLPDRAEAELGVAYATQDALLAESDFVVNLLPYPSVNKPGFSEKPGLSHGADLALDAAQLAGMKRGAYLVSCGSGSVLDEAALADAVAANRLAGVALDTFEWEPIRPDNPLRRLALEGRNVLLTPHTAAGAPPVGVIPSRTDDYAPIVQFLRHNL